MDEVRHGAKVDVNIVDRQKYVGVDAETESAHGPVKEKRSVNT